MQGGGQMIPGVRDLLEWLLWITLFGFIIAATLWIVCVKP